MSKKKNNIERKVAPPEFKKIIEQVASFFAPGSFYYYIFNFDNLTFDYVHHTVKDVLGIDPAVFNIEKFLTDTQQHVTGQVKLKDDSGRVFWMV